MYNLYIFVNLLLWSFQFGSYGEYIFIQPLAKYYHPTFFFVEIPFFFLFFFVFEIPKLSWACIYCLTFPKRQHVCVLFMVTLQHRCLLLVFTYSLFQKLFQCVLSFLAIVYKANLYFHQIFLCSYIWDREFAAMFFPYQFVLDKRVGLVYYVDHPSG